MNRISAQKLEQEFIIIPKKTIQQYIKQNPAATEMNIRLHFGQELLPLHFTKSQKELLFTLFSYTEMIDFITPKITFEKLFHKIWKLKYPNMTIHQFSSLQSDAKSKYKLLHALVTNPNLSFEQGKLLAPPPKKVHFQGDDKGQIAPKVHLFQKDQYPTPFVTSEQYRHAKVRDYLHRKIPDLSLEEIDTKHLVVHYQHLKTQNPNMSEKRILEYIEFYRLIQDE